jgi:hypothetical protein
VVGAGEGHQLLASGTAEGLGGGPALQHPQEGRRSHVIAGDGQCGRKDGKQIGAQAVEQPPLVAVGPLVVAGDGAQLTGGLAVRDQRVEGREAVPGEVAGDASIFRVVLFLGRPPPPRDHIGVDRHHDVAGLD